MLKFDSKYLNRTLDFKDTLIKLQKHRFLKGDKSLLITVKNIKYFLKKTETVQILSKFTSFS